MSLLFRTDASVAIGTGHVMRCLALAQAWQDRGQRAVFAMAESTPALQSRLANERCEVLAISSNAGDAGDAEQVIALAHQEGAEWIVVDGYRFTAEYQRALKAAGCKILFLDDYGHASQYSADLVMNQNVGASEALYASRESYTRLLLGPRYALLRREFTEWRGWKREIAPECRRLLVMMGGSDPENITARVISALQGFHDLEVTVVVGGSNPRLPELTQLVARSGQKITLREDVTNMPELMASADLAVSAAGSTTWELCLMGLPALLIDVAPNQTALAKELNRTGCAVHAGDRSITASAIAERLQDVLGSREQRQLLFRRCRTRVDGCGTDRVLSELTRG
jgi:UDP-2,4-diacetamido-2,4,6-trideoxy-beta-L-altropyranose hydrolase